MAEVAGAAGLRRLWTLLRARLALRGAAPVDALAQLLAQLGVAAVGFTFIHTLSARAPSVAGWSSAELLLLWGQAELSLGLFTCLFAGLWVLHRRYVLGGELEVVLLRPVDPLLQILLAHLNLGGLPALAVGALLVARALPHLPQAPALPQAIGWIALSALSGALLLGGLLTAVSAIGFRVAHQGSAIGLIYQGTAWARYPLDLHPPWLQQLFCTLLPFGFLASLPTAALLGRGPLGWAQPLVALSTLAAGVCLWRVGLRSYGSGG